MSGEITLNPNSLANSIDRAQAILNAYLLLGRLDPPDTDTVIQRQIAELQEKLSTIRGSWSTFMDYTLEIIPYELAFDRYRSSYQKLGKNVSGVPVINLQTEKTDPPTYSPAPKFEPPPPAPIPENKPEGMSTTTMLLIGGGIAAALLLLLGKKKGLSGMSGDESAHRFNAELYMKQAEREFQLSKSEVVPRDEQARLRNVHRLLSRVDGEIFWLSPDNYMDILKRKAEIQREASNRPARR